jgi:hypothetical protein
MEALTWRWWLGFGAAGCALTLACRSDWRAVAVAGVVVLVPVVAWVRGEFATTAELMRQQPEEPVAMTPAEAAATFTALARDIDGDLAGGVPAKAVAQAAADRARRYGREVRSAIKATTASGLKT